MPQNLLKNGDFEADWSNEKSHRCLVFREGAGLQEKDVGNIFTPPGWTTWFRHDPGTWDQPEVRDAWEAHDPNRVHSGQKGMLLFTFFRRHDAGFLQRVPVTPGTRLRLTAWAHAWSNHNIEGYAWCNDDGRCSCGVGRDAAFILEGEAPELNGDPWNDAIPNFLFYLGIDPSGGIDPLADTVAWGRGAHIYNEHAQPPAVEATAKSDTVTVFLRSRTMWAFKHNDAYWDNVELVALDDVPKPEPESGRGVPREQYRRIYVLLPPGSSADWALAVVDGSWDQRRYTIGGSADDAGIGDLDDRRVIAVNPERWPSDLRGFFKQHYTGVDYTAVEAKRPAELKQKLKQL
jgi:hypothetical protein